MHRFLGIVVCTLGGAAATLTLSATTSRTGAMSFGGSQVRALYDSGAATATVGILFAVLATAVVTRQSTATVVVGVGLLGVAAAALVHGSSLPARYGGAIAAGLVLGGLATSTDSVVDERRRAPSASVALAIGALAGLVLARPLSSLRFVDDRPRRYADYLPASQHTITLVPATAVVTVLALVALGSMIVAALKFGIEDDGKPDPPARRAVIGGCLLPVAGLFAYWWLRETVFSGAGLGLHAWVYGYLLLAAALVFAFVLPSRTGMLWVAATAFVAGDAVSSVTGNSVVLVALPLIGLVLGAVVGYVVRQPLWGIAALGVCSAVAYAGSSDLTGLAIAAFAVPAAAALTVVAAVPSSSTVTASALGVPAVLTASVGAEFGWTAYTPLTDAGGLDADFVQFTSSATATTTLSLVTLAACAVVALLISRRPDTGPIARPRRGPDDDI